MQTALINSIFKVFYLYFLFQYKFIYFNWRLISLQYKQKTKEWQFIKMP